MCDNIEKEIQATKDYIETTKVLQDKLSNTIDIIDDSINTDTPKHLSPKLIGKTGLTCTMDGAWQKRGTGTTYNSRTGHNLYWVDTPI